MAVWHCYVSDLYSNCTQSWLYMHFGADWVKNKHKNEQTSKQTSKNSIWEGRLLIHDSKPSLWLFAHHYMSLTFIAIVLIVIVIVSDYIVYSILTFSKVLIAFNPFYPRHGYIRTVTVPKLQTLSLGLNAHTVKFVSCTHFLYFRTTQIIRFVCV